jgi:hypothetical protein
MCGGGCHSIVSAPPQHALLGVQQVLPQSALPVGNPIALRVCLNIIQLADPMRGAAAACIAGRLRP